MSQRIVLWIRGLCYTIQHMVHVSYLMSLRTTDDKRDGLLTVYHGQHVTWTWL